MNKKLFRKIKKNIPDDWMEVAIYALLFIALVGLLTCLIILRGKLPN